jgi:hypothetical protein
MYKRECAAERPHSPAPLPPLAVIGIGSSYSLTSA